ncbi:GumC family protein [Sulfitobacter aestuarii]|uniref:non-specific protein-tyrosine kinase n=1 Tax=Sulfitobacter aestuarii TaxID=2161676 RepID=A0ABW5U3U2_9RHOB
MTEFPKKQQFAPSLPETEDDSIDLAALAGTLWRGKWIIALATALALLIGGYYAFVVATPLYRATSVVILQTKQDNIVDLQSVVGGMSGDSTEVNSEIEVLRSRGLMGKVVDRLDLINDPEFNGELREPGLVANVTGGIRNSIGALFGGDEASELSDIEAQSRRDAVVSALLDKVSISNIRQSLVFNVTVETESARKSARIADAIVELYILNQIEVKFEATEQATTWLTNRVGELQVELEAAETKASDFSSRTELVSIEGLQALERQIKDMRERIATAEQTVSSAQAELEGLRAAEAIEDKVALADDTQLTRMAQRLDDGPEMVAAFDNRYQMVINRKALDLARAEQQLEALRRSAVELERQVARQGQDLITLQQLTREAEATRTLYEYFLTRLKETSAQQGIQQADSRVLSNAVVPGAPSEPRKSRILALSMILGMMIGAGIVLLREMRNNSFRTARELENHTGLTVLGQIPEIPAGKRPNVLRYLLDKPTSAAAEAVRNLRTSLMLSNVDNPPQVILSTSSVPGEGKTTNSLALAANLLGLGKRVLVIEGDIRRRTLNEYFPTLPTSGIVGVLSGEMRFEDAVHRPADFGADVLAGDKTATNAADLFSSDRFRDFIEEMRGRYDAIIIDTPPVLVVPDARIIAQVADAILFTVYWDSTSKQQVEEALRMFDQTKQRISGLVLSQISARGMKRYGYGGQYGAYGAYGAKYYTE